MVVVAAETSTVSWAAHPRYSHLSWGAALLFLSTVAGGGGGGAVFTCRGPRGKGAWTEVPASEVATPAVPPLALETPSPREAARRTVCGAAATTCVPAESAAPSMGGGDGDSSGGDGGSSNRPLRDGATTIHSGTAASTVTADMTAASEAAGDGTCG